MTQADDRSPSPETPSCLSFIQILLFPLKTLWTGNFSALFYAAVCAWGSMEFASFLKGSSDEMLTGLLGADFAFLPQVELATWFFFVLLFPLVIVGAGLPVRLIWLHDAIHFGPLLRETRTCALRFIHILRMTWSAPIYAVVPSVAVLLIRKLAARHELSDQVHKLILVLLVFALLLSAWKLLKWLFLLLFSTFVEVEPWFAVQNYKRILGFNTIQFIVCGMCGFAVAGYLYFAGSLRDSSWFAPLLAFVLWYTMGMLIALVLEAAEAFAQSTGHTIRAVPQQAPRA